ncbi:MAG: esterase-like activity of phytase family protein [Rhizobiales bacterium]|nr:esterase-like activity of phytase family protein [Hyphomicrobiales bacterium]
MRAGSLAALILGSLIAGPAAAEDIQARYYLSDDTLLRIGQFTFDGGKTLNLTVGIGSAAWRGPNDSANVIWTVGDRGPNIACSEMKGIAGIDFAPCKGVQRGRVYPAPSYAPSIYRVMLLDNGTFRVTDVITLKDRDGNPLSGMLNPLKTAATENAMDGSGKPLPREVNGFDAEGIVRLKDGTFWIGEENGPSIAHFSADGRMIARYVPQGTEGEYAGAKYDVKGTLPAILAKRAVNRGIESMAVSPDEQFLYFIVQNPLANPDVKSYQQAKNTRLFKIERASMKVIGEYVYTLDDPGSFRRDPSKRQNDPRISEMMAIGLDRLVVLERTEQTTKLYEINLADATNIAGTKWDDLATSPTLEQTDVGSAGIKPAPKTLRLDTANLSDIVGKTEGLALLGDGSLLMINDDDFGILGGRTQIVVLRGTGIERR